VEGASVLGDGTDDRLVEALGSTGGDLDGDLDLGGCVTEMGDDLLDDPVELEAEPLGAQRDASVEPSWLRGRYRCVGGQRCRCRRISDALG